MDFHNVYEYAINEISILDSPRMPWHDASVTHALLPSTFHAFDIQVHMTLVGPVVLDIVQHFTDRWNEIKRRKVSRPCDGRKIHVIDTCLVSIRHVGQFSAKPERRIFIVYRRYAWLALPHPVPETFREAFDQAMFRECSRLA
jgi:hypothetical protein